MSNFSVSVFHNFFISVFVSINGIKLFLLTDISVSVNVNHTAPKPLQKPLADLYTNSITTITLDFSLNSQFSKAWMYSMKVNSCQLLDQSHQTFYRSDYDVTTKFHSTRGLYISNNSM